MKYVMMALLVFIVVLSCITAPDALPDEIVGSIDRILDAPGNEVTGLAWSSGYLWAVDEGSSSVYRLNPQTGDMMDSFVMTYSGSVSATGLAVSETHGLVLVGLWNGSTTGYVYKYTLTGGYVGSVDMCGG